MIASILGSVFRKVVAVSAAVVFAAAAVVVFPGSASASPAVDVYSSPGRHDVNGRQWRTWCEDYSSTVQRCFTEIMSGGVWVHNNLTYLPSPRQGWGSNPLGRNGQWASAGNKWRTECDTAATGRNGCRSYMMVDGRWVFNNIVRFSVGGQTTERVDTSWRPDQKTWTVRLREVSNNSQAEIDVCSRNPAFWNGRQQIAAHNYCNGWESNSWHDMKPGDRVIVHDMFGVRILEGIVERDFTARYGNRPVDHPNEVSPAMGADYFWLQTSWPNSVLRNSNHFIVVKRI